MSYRTPPPPQRTPSRVSVALLANIVGLLLLAAAVAAVLVAAWRFDDNAGLAVTGLGAGFLGWRLTTVPDEA